MRSFYATLDYQDLLAVNGQDSEKFLQGQLTCDLAEVMEGMCVPGAACTNKGRVYASFRLLRNDQVFYLAMQGGVLPVAMATLKKYIPFYKAALADAGSRFQRLGLAGPEAEARLAGHLPVLPDRGRSVMQNGCVVLNVSDLSPRYEIWLPAGSANPFADLLAGLTRAEPVAWQVLDLEAGLCFIQPGDVEAYTPEELNMDLAGFISFSKGCYTGQEIVARMHYRGKAGKRLFAVSAQTPSPLTNCTLHDGNGKALGQVFNWLGPEAGHACGQVVLKADTDTNVSYILETGTARIPARIASLADRYSNPA